MEMICPDIFEYYEKSKNTFKLNKLILNSNENSNENSDYNNKYELDYSNIFFKKFDKETFDNYMKYYIEIKDPERCSKMKKYIEYGFDINEKITNSQNNWLEFATIHEDIAIVGFLVKSGANIHLIDSDGINLVFKSLLLNNKILLKFYLSLGVNPNNQIFFGNTPLVFSCMMDNCIECAKILIQSPTIDLNHINNSLSIIEIVVSKIYKGNKEHIELLHLILQKKK